MLILFLLSLPKNCKDNEECFNSASSICKKAKANLLKDEDVYNYYIRGKKDDNCVVKITMLQVSEKKSLSMKEGLEGRYMDCAVPMKLMSEKPINKMSEINDYCTGPLKEAILEILRNEALSSGIAENALSEVKKYTWQKRAEKILEFIG